MEEKFKVTFIHELGHYFCAKYFKRIIEYISIFPNEKNNNYISGRIKYKDYKDPVDECERIIEIVISSYGCIFEYIFTGNKFLVKCFSSNGEDDNASLRENICWDVNPYQKEEIQKKLHNILETYLNELENNNLKLIIDEIITKLDYLKQSNSEGDFFPANLILDIKNLKELDEILDINKIKSELSDSYRNLYTKVEELRNQYI